MKPGDIVRFTKKRIGGPSKMYDKTGIVVSEDMTHGINVSYVEILVDGKVVSVNWKDVEVISEKR